MIHQGGSYCPKNATLYSGYPVPPSTCQSLHLPSQQSREAAVTITSSEDINRHKEFNKNEGRREGRTDGRTDGLTEGVCLYIGELCRYRHILPSFMT